MEHSVGRATSRHRYAVDVRRPCPQTYLLTHPSLLRLVCKRLPLAREPSRLKPPPSLSQRLGPEPHPLRTTTIGPSTPFLPDLTRHRDSLQSPQYDFKSNARMTRKSRHTRPILPSTPLYVKALVAIPPPTPSTLPRPLITQLYTSLLSTTLQHRYRRPCPSSHPMW